jgi:hypothetical protein
MAEVDAIIEKVEKDPKRGFVTWLKGHSLPFFGFPTVQQLDKLTPVKRMFELLLAGQHAAFSNSFRSYEQLSPSSRALYDLWNELIEFEQTERRRDIFRKMRDLSVHFVECDTAYRWRMQWAVQRLDKARFALSPEDRYWFAKSPQFDHSEDDLNL